MGAARTTAEILRAAAGRDPNDRELSDLVGELATRSDAFRTHWAGHNVRAAEPGSRSEEALNLLGSLAATIDLAEPQRAVDRG